MCSHFHRRDRSLIVASQLQVSPSTTGHTPSDRHSPRGTPMSHIARFFTPALLRLCWSMLVPSYSCRTPFLPHRVPSWRLGLKSCIPWFSSHSLTLSPWPSPCPHNPNPSHCRTHDHEFLLSPPRARSTHPLLCPMPQPWPCSSLLLTSISAILLDPPALPFSSLILLRP